MGDRIRGFRSSLNERGPSDWRAYRAVRSRYVGPPGAGVPATPPRTRPLTLEDIARAMGIPLNRKRPGE